MVGCWSCKRPAGARVLFISSRRGCFGRRVRVARCLSVRYWRLCATKSPRRIGWAFALRPSIPTRDEVQEILDALEDVSEGLSVTELEGAVNLSRGRIQKTICQKLVEERNPQPAPEWVTCIPSRRHPDLVPDFSRRLAEMLGLLRNKVIYALSDAALVVNAELNKGGTWAGARSNWKRCVWYPSTCVRRVKHPWAWRP